MSILSSIRKNLSKNSSEIVKNILTYLTNIPVNPQGKQEWSAGHTGYTLMKNEKGMIKVTSCETEDSNIKDGSISISR